MLALHGIKVLDLCHLGPGMYCTMILSDFGAEVIRIDRPREHIDTIQTSDSIWSFERLTERVNSSLNRNKKSIALNLKSRGALEILYRLIELADVIVEGFRPGTTKRLGIDYERARAINPKIVYCSMSGFGQSGPYVDLPGHDITYSALGGALNMIGEPNKPPAIPMNFVADWAGGTFQATIGILIALLARAHTGKGQFVDISYTDGVASMITPFAYDYLNYGIDWMRGCTSFNGGFAGYNVYQTKEGKYIAIGCFEPWFWENLCRFVGREDFIPFQFAEGNKREEIFTYLKQFFLGGYRDIWFDLMKDKNIPVGKVYQLNEVLSDPQLLHREMIQEINPANGKREKTVGINIKLSDTPGNIKCGAPIIGEHTREVLIQLGYTEDIIKKLASEGSIALASR